VPQKDLNSFPQLIADLYHEMSWIVFWCMIAGFAIGGFAATYWLVQLQIAYPMPASYGRSRRQGGAWGFFLIIPAAAIIGMICGIAFGVVLELLVDFIRGPEAKKKKAEHRKLKRQHRHAQRQLRQPSTGIQASPDRHFKRDERFRLGPDD
jgi:hypothetical protein